jgi:hypothetical protein
MQHLLRKKIILLIALVGFATTAFSQFDEVFQPDHDDLHSYLGMSLGMTNSYLSFTRSSNFLSPNPKAANKINPVQTTYINLGLTGTLKLTNHILVRTNPTLLISDGIKTFNFKQLTNDIFTDTGTITYSPSSVIIDVPFSIKMQSDRYKAFGYADIMRHYLLAGVKFGFDLGAEKKAFKYSTKTPQGAQYLNVIKGTDMALELGLGVSFYLRYATISPEVKFSYGLRDLRKINEPITYPLVTSLQKITSNFIYFTILIEN